MNSPTFSLPIPSQSHPEPDSLLLNPKKLAAWVAELPKTNMKDLARQIYRQLAASNRTQLSPAMRIKGLSCFPQSVLYLITNLERHFLNTPLPLSEKRHNIALLCRELYNQQMLGYKCAVVGILTERQPDRELLALAIHRALLFSLDTLYHAAITYDAVTMGLWRDIHQLYRLAVAHRLEKHPVSADPHQTRPATTCHQAYQQVIAFGLGAPARLRQNEIKRLYMGIETWAKFMHISESGFLEPNFCRFLLCDQDDTPPTHSVMISPNALDVVRLIETQDMVYALREGYEDFPAEPLSPRVIQDSTQMTQHLARQLIRSWSAAPRRQFMRSGATKEIATITGLTAIYIRLQNKNVTTPGSRPPPAFGLVETGDLPSTDLLPAFDESSIDGYETFGTTVLLDSQEVVRIWAEDSLNSAIVANSFKTLNSSAGGYCIHWKGQKEAPEVTVGELLGIQSDEHPKHLSLAVIRWLQQDTREGLQLGVELISPEVRAVETCLFDKKVTQTMHRTLMLPKQAIMGQETTLLVVPLTYRVGQTILVWEDDKHTQKVHLTRLVESTGAFDRFEFLVAATDMDRTGDSDAIIPGKDVPEASSTDKIDNILSRL
ncbi:cyclic-di-GMP-binding protein [Gammaproteobacteria bacterium]